MSYGLGFNAWPAKPLARVLAGHAPTLQPARSRAGRPLHHAPAPHGRRIFVMAPSPVQIQQLALFIACLIAAKVDPTMLAAATAALTAVTAAQNPR